MTETPTRRGRPRGVESQHVMVRMPVDLIAQIDAYAASLQERIGISDMAISRGMAIRELVKRGLQSVQAGPQMPQEPRPAAPPAQASQPPPHLATVDEPEPMAAPPASAAPRPESALDEGRIVETRTPRSQRGLPPEKLQEIAEAAAEYDKLSLDDLSKLLFDRNIYRARDSHSGEEKPVNRGNLQKWLKRAQTEGML
jgi:hypothetical protein